MSDIITAKDPTAIATAEGEIHSVLLQEQRRVVNKIGLSEYHISFDQLVGQESRDVTKCKLGNSKVSCFAFAQAARVLGDLKAACSELGVNRAQGLQALMFYALFRRPIPTDDQWFYDLGTQNLRRK